MREKDYFIICSPKKKRGIIFCVCRIYSTFFPHRIIFFLVCLCQATRNSPNENNALRYPVPPLTGYILYSPKAAGVTFWELFEKLQNIVCFSCISSNIKCCRGPFHDSNKNKFPRGIRNRLAVTALNDSVPIFRIYFYRALSGIKYGSHLRLELIPLLLNVFGLVVFSLVFSSSCVINMRIDFFLSLLFLFLFLS